MSLATYLQTIKDINPQKIYVENVRSVLKVPTQIAKLICEMAVTDRFFLKRIGVECPNCKRIISSYKNISEIPNEIICTICEDTDAEISKFNSKNTNKITFYILNE